MMDIEVKMKDKSTKWFKHEGRAGGSYSKSIRYEGSFIIITDEYYNETAIPVDLIEEVKTYQRGY